MRQFDLSDPSNVYGAVTFQVLTYPEHSIESLKFNDSLTENGKINVYPNPALDKLYLTMAKNQTITATVQIHDAFGRRVFVKTNLNINNGNSEIDISSLASGIYIISIENKDGFSEKHKFVKK